MNVYNEWRHDSVMIFMFAFMPMINGNGKTVFLIELPWHFTNHKGWWPSFNNCQLIQSCYFPWICTRKDDWTAFISSYLIKHKALNKITWCEATTLEVHCVQHMSSSSVLFTPVLLCNILHCRWPEYSL